MNRYIFSRTWVWVFLIFLLPFPLYSCGSSDHTSEQAIDLPQDDLNENLDKDAVFPHHSPLGKGVGACPGRVVWSWDRKSVDWSGEGYWWELDHFNEASIQKLTDDGIARLANTSDVQSGWQALFAYNNGVRSRSGGYKPGQKITRGVKFVSRTNGVPDMSAPIVWSAHRSGVTNYLPTCVTEADYLINLANLKGHNYGITLCAKNHFGSFINDYRMRAPQQAGLHGNLTQRKMNVYSVLVDLMGNYQLGAKTMLYMLDALICPSENTVSISPRNSIWQQPPFDGDYTCSLFFSQDPVAIDGVGADFLMNEPTCTSLNSALRNNATVENYIHEAALVASPPSKTAYRDGNGKAIVNLGVHEHWNNVQEKKYSRNFGKPEGIELVLVDNN